MPKAARAALRATAKRCTAAPSIKLMVQQYLGSAATSPTAVDGAAAASAAAATAAAAAVRVPVEEDHPLGPYVHGGSRVLLYGTFPPVRKSINFYYPNANNDMWKILGTVFYNNPGMFYKTVDTPKRQRLGPSMGTVLDEVHIRRFASSASIGFCDGCRRVRRQLGNSSDDNIEVLDRTEMVSDVLTRAPQCAAIITTGTLALTMLMDDLAKHGSFRDENMAPLQAFRLSRRGQRKYNLPPLGGRFMWVPDACCPCQRAVWVYRAPSTSRALPLRLEVKASHYRRAIGNHLDLPALWPIPTEISAGVSREAP